MKLSCSEFLDQMLNGSELDDILSEMYWNGDFNTEKVFEYIQEQAKIQGILLIDIESFDYNTVLFELYNCAELGLS